MSVKTLLEGYPSNIKGWKKNFFFISGDVDDWEFSLGISKENGVPRVLRSRGVLGLSSPAKSFL